MLGVIAIHAGSLVIDSGTPQHTSLCFEYSAAIACLLSLLHFRATDSSIPIPWKKNWTTGAF